MRRDVYGRVLYDGLTGRYGGMCELSITSDGTDSLMVLFPTRKEICEDEMISQPYRVGVKSREPTGRIANNRNNRIIKSMKKIEFP